MYIRATHKLKEYKYSWLKKNHTVTLTGQQVIEFMNGDHMEIDDTQAQNLINDGLAQQVWKPI